jgi:amidase
MPVTAIDYPTATAGELAAAVRDRKVSAVELVETAIARIEAMDGDINAVVVRDFDQARADAKIADEKVAAGVQGVLLGVPMTVKESYDLKGFPTTWGVPEMAGYIARQDALPVRKLKAAGAIVLGKTNVPPVLGDWQSTNPIYGRTNNPHDLTRSPGGSSGGSAAALAAGYVSLEMGSDIGGSIRIPAALCGVYGHKTSYMIMPMDGHAPGGQQSAPPPIAVGGPLARSAEDLATALDILAAPVGEDVKAYRLVLPPPRHARLSDYRVLIVDEHPRCATGADVKQALETLAKGLERQGAKVSRDASLVPDLGYIHDIYLPMLLTFTMRRAPATQGGRTPTTANRWLDLLDAQAIIRKQWAELFESFDVVIAPAFGTGAFKHFDNDAWAGRELFIDGKATSYGDQIAWAGMATLPLLPATAMPIGLGDEGMPLGAQIIGPYLEDRMTIAFAGLAAQV